jgi:hypothetical protein
MTNGWNGIFLVIEITNAFHKEYNERQVTILVQRESAADNGNKERQFFVKQ